jgi:hypothetical protein
MLFFFLFYFYFIFQDIIIILQEIMDMTRPFYNYVVVGDLAN